MPATKKNYTEDYVEWGTNVDNTIGDKMQITISYSDNKQTPNNECGE